MSEPRSRVLVVEDEPEMRKFLKAALGAHGYSTLDTGTRSEALILLTTQRPDILLLDLGLPDGDGIELTRELRQWAKLPIIVISARGRESDKIAALDAGADDYLTKPFGVGELLARMRVAERHAGAQMVQGVEPILECQDVRVDLARRVVTRAGIEVHLTPLEYRLLVFLAKNAGKVVTHRTILREVWGQAYASQTHYVRVHMAELRKKIEADPSRPRLLITEPGVGYRLRTEG